MPMSSTRWQTHSSSAARRRQISQRVGSARALRASVDRNTDARTTEQPYQLSLIWNGGWLELQVNSKDRRAASGSFRTQVGADLLHDREPEVHSTRCLGRTHPSQDGSLRI